MKLLVTSFVLFISISAHAAETMFCQFWNSVTHSPVAGTVVGEFTTGQATIGKFFEQRISPDSNAALGFRMEFSRKNLNINKADQFVAELYRTDNHGIKTVLNRYVKNFPYEKLENMVLTAEVDMDRTYFISALCSPQ